MKTKFVLSTLILCASLDPGSGLRAQSQHAIDAARMQRDLDIMEMVLERLLNENNAPLRPWGGPSARGVYLPGFGVLFQVPQTLSRFSYFEFQSEGEGEAAETFATELIEFFSRYADAIGQLREQDRIAIHRGAGPKLSIFLNFSGAVNEQIHTANPEVLAWVRKSEVEALQTGRLNEDDFRKQVKFQAAEAEGAAKRANQKEIDVLAGIFEAALGLHAANGLHLENYGAVFFTSADFNDAWRAARKQGAELNDVPAEEGTRVSTPRAIEEYLRATERDRRERARNWQSEFEQFKEKLFAVIADYGHTLRNLRAEERVVVVADLPNAPVKQARQLVCAVKKQQLEQYHNRKISREQLYKAMALFEN